MFYSIDIEDVSTILEYLYLIKVYLDIDGADSI